MMFHELVQSVQVNVREKLAGIIADGKAGFVVGVKKGFMRRNQVKEQAPSLFLMIFGGIMKNDFFDQGPDPGGVLASGQYFKKDFLIDTDKKGADIDMKEPCFFRAVARHLSHEILKSCHGGMGSLAFPACVRVMNEDPLPFWLQITHQQMVDDPVPEMGREDFPVFRLFRYKAGGWGWNVASGGKFFQQQQNFLFGVYLKTERGNFISLVLPAIEIAPVEILKSKGIRDHFQGRTARAPLLLLLSTSFSLTLPLLRLTLRAREAPYRLAFPGNPGHRKPIFFSSRTS